MSIKITNRQEKQFLYRRISLNLLAWMM